MITGQYSAIDPNCTAFNAEVELEPSEYLALSEYAELWTAMFETSRWRELLGSDTALRIRPLPNQSNGATADVDCARF